MACSGSRTAPAEAYVGCNAVSGRVVRRVPRSRRAQLMAQAEMEGVSLDTRDDPRACERLGP